MLQPLARNQFSMLSGLLVLILDVVLTCIWMNGALPADSNGDFFQTLSLSLFVLTVVTGGFLLSRYRLPRIYWIIPILALIAAIEESAWIIMVFGRLLVVLGGEHRNLHDFFGTAYLLLKDAELGWGSAVVGGGILFGGGAFFFHSLESFFVNRRPLLIAGLAVGFLVLAQVSDAVTEMGGYKKTGQSPISMIVEELLENNGALLFLLAVVALHYEKRED